MKDFELVLPKTLDEAVGELPDGEKQSWDSARVLAGGQDLIPELKDYVTSADRLVNLKSIESNPELAMVGGGDVISIGALVTIAALEDSEYFAKSFPVVQQAAASVASPQIRTVATLGGNLCQRPRCWYYRHEGTVCLKKGGTECFSYGGQNRYNAILGGGPSYIVHPSDLAPALIAVDAEIELRSPRMQRTMPLEEFYFLPSEGDVTRENVLLPNEVLTHVRVPKKDGWKSTYVKFKERGSFDFALSAVALAVRMDGDSIAEARVVLGGVAPKPWRCQSTEAFLVGKKNTDEVAWKAGEDALLPADPLEHNGYKVPLTKGLIVKAMRALR